jgi:hypothetical protein
VLLALAIAQAATTVVAATCSVPNDPQQREWRLERRDVAGASASEWRVVFRGRMLDTPIVELRLPGAVPVVSAEEVRLSYATGNGGRTLEWRAANGASTLDLHVSHGLEVNVEADLDPAVDHLNTEGILPVTCILGSGDLVISRSGAVDRAASELVVAGGAAWSVQLFKSVANRRYAVQFLSWGRALTRPLGPGILRGRFAWAVEATPIFAQTAPSHVYGFGLAPVVWRWNFEPRPRWSAFGELSMGGLWTSDPIPEKASRANFTAHWGGGVRLPTSARSALVLGYRLQHISNGNNLGSNPGVNSHVVLAGLSLTRPH